jgi:hypothetical protein
MAILGQSENEMGENEYKKCLFSSSRLAGEIRFLCSNATLLGMLANRRHWRCRPSRLAGRERIFSEAEISRIAGSTRRR